MQSTVHQALPGVQGCSDCMRCKTSCITTCTCHAASHLNARQTGGQTNGPVGGAACSARQARAQLYPGGGTPRFGTHRSAEQQRAAAVPTRSREDAVFHT